MIEFSSQLSNAYVAVLGACAAIAVVVFGLMLYSIAAFRREPQHDVRGTTAEVLWAIVPIAIVIAMATPAITGLVSVPGTTAPELAHQAPAQPGPDVAEEPSRKAFNDGVVPL